MAGQRIISKQLAGVEDILLDASGEPTVTQPRAGGNKTITKVNTATIPYEGKRDEVGFKSAETALKERARTVDTIADMALIDGSKEDTVIVKDPDRGGIFVYDATKLKSEDNGGTIFANSFDASSTTGCYVRQYDGPVNVKWFGASSQRSDNEEPIQKAADFATLSNAVLTGGDTLYRVSNKILIRCDVRDLRVDYVGVLDNVRVFDIGTEDGSLLTRDLTVDNVYVTVSSDTNGIVGITINTYCRNVIVKNSFCKMLGTGNNTEHIGFEICSRTIANSVTGAGTYQNHIQSCSVIGATHGFVIKTLGTEAEAAADPQANGNFISGCFVYSFKTTGLLIGPGAQENVCSVRVDTAVDQTGLGTNINVIDIYSNYNKIDFSEEVGTRADTQYSVYLRDGAIYNNVRGSAQQIVSGFLGHNFVDDGMLFKNIVEQTGAGLLHNKAGEIVTETKYYSQAAGLTQNIFGTWTAPCACVVLSFGGKLNDVAPTGGDTRLYFAKNGAFSVDNRVVWIDSEAVSYKEVNLSNSASVAFPDYMILRKGDRIYFAGDTPSGGGAVFNAVIKILVLNDLY